ncbi:extracellular solute-binding protein [Streptomyces roseoverticillatus]|uniref:Extracellular solute-binding protein n=1 Tax=Streptomyces roseoverticillatus TaxID=66429 RepID=A0ABV3J1G3_9ACTN
MERYQPRTVVEPPGPAARGRSGRVRLRRTRDRGRIHRFTGNDCTGDFNKGGIAACIAWAGDLVQLQAGNTDIQHAIPTAGRRVSGDNLLVPRNTRHQRNAERLIDYDHQPKAAARLAAAISYAGPVAGLRDELAKADKEPAGDSLVIPSEAMTSKAHAFRSLTTAEDEAFEAAFSELTGA